MGKSKIIHRDALIRDNGFEKGFGVYSLVCDETCGSTNIMLGDTIHNGCWGNKTAEGGLPCRQLELESLAGG